MIQSPMLSSLGPISAIVLAGMNRLLIITNEFHMMRTKFTFDWIINVRRNDNSISDKYELYYLSVPDKGLSAGAVSV